MLAEIDALGGNSIDNLCFTMKCYSHQVTQFSTTPWKVICCRDFTNKLWVAKASEVLKLGTPPILRLFEKYARSISAHSRQVRKYFGRINSEGWSTLRPTCSCSLLVSKGFSRSRIIEYLSKTNYGGTTIMLYGKQPSVVDGKPSVHKTRSITWLDLIICWYRFTWKIHFSKKHNEDAKYIYNEDAFRWARSRRLFRASGFLPLNIYPSNHEMSVHST